MSLAMLETTLRRVRVFAGLAVLFAAAAAAVRLSISGFAFGGVSEVVLTALVLLAGLAALVACIAVPRQLRAEELVDIPVVHEREMPKAGPGCRQGHEQIGKTLDSAQDILKLMRSASESALSANTMMRDANSVVAASNASLEELNRRMGEITAQGAEIGKVIKDIDSIAFQTNLLA